jgi:hypothetical protein
MAKRASTEEKRTAIRAPGREPATGDTRKAPGKALNGANTILVAQAAKFAGRLGPVGSIPEFSEPLRTEITGSTKELPERLPYNRLLRLDPTLRSFQSSR